MGGDSADMARQAKSATQRLFYGKGMQRLNPDTNPLDKRELKLEIWEMVYLVLGTVCSYVLFAADLTAGRNYLRAGTAEDTAWYTYCTFGFAFLPGLFHCLAQHYAYYEMPTDVIKFRQIKVGERVPLLEKRDPTMAGWVILYCINILQLRMVYEAYLSFRWGFVTGAYADSRVVQVVFDAVPQLCLQTWVIFRQWNEEVEWDDWSPTFVVYAFALICVTIMPNSSPCFNNNDRLVTLRGIRGKAKNSDDEDTDEEEESGDSDLDSE